jgi:hypothetical protein
VKVHFQKIKRLSGYRYIKIKWQITYIQLKIYCIIICCAREEFEDTITYIHLKIYCIIICCVREEFEDTITYIQLKTYCIIICCVREEFEDTITYIQLKTYCIIICCVREEFEDTITYVQLKTYCIIICCVREEFQDTITYIQLKTDCIIICCVREEFEDTKEVISIRISKNRQHNGQKKTYKRTNNDLQNIHINLKIEYHEPNNNREWTQVLRKGQLKFEIRLFKQSIFYTVSEAWDTVVQTLIIYCEWSLR